MERFKILENEHYVEMLLTAAHCVYSEGSYPAGSSFIWQMNGNTAKEIVAVSHIFVPKKYIETGDTQYDYAICVLNKCAGDAREAYHVLDYNIKSPLGSETVTIGYPGEPIGDRSTMYCSRSRITEYKDGDKKWWAVDNGLAARGASGGPWVVDRKAVGVNSAFHDELKLVRSPQFSREFEDLYKTAVQRAPTPVISKLKLINDYGWFVAKLWFHHGGKKEGEQFQDHTHILINSEYEVSLENKGLLDFTIVSIHADVVWGIGKSGCEKFLYDPGSSKGACYSISGLTRNNELKYKGLY